MLFRSGSFDEEVPRLSAFEEGRPLLYVTVRRLWLWCALLRCQDKQLLSDWFSSPCFPPEEHDMLCKKSGSSTFELSKPCLFRSPTQNCTGLAINVSALIHASQDSVSSLRSENKRGPIAQEHKTGCKPADKYRREVVQCTEDVVHDELQYRGPLNPDCKQ